jgi:aspartate-semialdehyde dehydrogenase
MKKYRVAVVGIGAVGSEMVRVLKKRAFPMESLTILARSARPEVIDGETYQVQAASPEAFEGLDFAFFAGTEGAKGASKTYGWEAVKRGCIVIDNGDDFRMDPRVPLVVPEINADALRHHQGLISNPNCSTAIALMPLAPLHKVAKIRRIVCCTYQAVSGTGAAAIRELEQQVRAWVEGKPLVREVYPCQIAFNVIAQIGSPREDEPGYTTEEVKLRRETHKILGDSSIRVSSTCVRVPVFNGHSEALHVEFEKPITPEQARSILSKSPGVKVVDDIAKSVFPTPIECSGQYDVLVGRIRHDPSVEHGLAMFVSGDNLWKGAALNAIQIAEKMIEMGLR